MWFYRHACHPPLTRRRFVAGAAAALGLGGVRDLGARPSDPARPVIDEYATRPDDPWAVAHGIRAMGRAFTLQDGGSAVDFLLERHLAWLPAGAGRVLGFPPEVEVHPNMFLKTLLEAQVPLEHGFVREGRAHTVREVVDGARALFRPHVATSHPNRLPWSLIALTWTAASGRPRWTNGWGELVDLEAIVETALGMLERASAPIAEAMRDRRPLVAQAPVHQFTCGGTHMLYGLLTAIHRGHEGRDRAARVRRQVDLLVWRLDADVELIDRFYRARAGAAGAVWFQLDAKLKVLGHAEECLALAERRRLVSLAPAQRERREAAVRRVQQMLGELGQRGLGEARRLNQDLFRQLVGDTCHARHGLTLT
jgi:hypothetical protein